MHDFVLFIVILHFTLYFMSKVYLCFVYSTWRSAVLFVLRCWNKQKTDKSGFWLIDGKYYATWKGPLDLSWIGSDDLPCGYLTPGPSPVSAPAPSPSATLLDSGEMLQHDDWESAANQRAERSIANQSEMWAKQSGAQCRDFLKAEQSKEVWVEDGRTKEKTV